MPLEKLMHIKELLEMITIQTTKNWYTYFSNVMKVPDRHASVRFILPYCPAMSFQLLL